MFFDKSQLVMKKKNAANAWISTIQFFRNAVQRIKTNARTMKNKE